MNKVGGAFLAVGTVVVLGGAIFFGLTPTGHKIINDWKYALKKEDENIYENKKEVEDTCRSYIASYNADKNTYLQYKDSTDEFYLRLATEAKLRANNTATVYNEYFLKNKYVWKDNIPDDIYSKLELL